MSCYADFVTLTSVRLFFVPWFSGTLFSYIISLYVTRMPCNIILAISYMKNVQKKVYYNFFSQNGRFFFHFWKAKWNSYQQGIATKFQGINYQCLTDIQLFKLCEFKRNHTCWHIFSEKSKYSCKWSQRNIIHLNLFLTLIHKIKAIFSIKSFLVKRKQVVADI